MAPGIGNKVLCSGLSTAAGTWSLQVLALGCSQFCDLDKSQFSKNRVMDSAEICQDPQRLFSLTPNHHTTV